MAKSRTSRSALFRLIQHSALPIYAVSGSLKIVFCNEAMCRWAGQDDEFLTGLTCVYQSSSEEPLPRQIAAGLCPPPDSFKGPPSQAWVSVPSGAGLEYRQATFYPVELPEAEAADAGVIAIVHGPGCDRPAIESIAQETPDPRELHTAIRQWQFESAVAIQIDRIVGNSPAAHKVRQQVHVAGQTGCPVTITGPPGSGRHSLATLIHYSPGPEMTGPLIPIDCALCDAESLQETIKNLYRQYKSWPDEPLGRIFLQDVDRLGKAAQAELLGFLKLPDFELPLLATASANGETEILEALWPRLSTIVIELPPLASRRGDIPFLAQAIVEQFNETGHRQLAGIDDDTMSLLVRYSWPGELSELTAALDEACRKATTPLIRTDDLPADLRIALRADRQSSRPESTVIDLDQFLAEIEDELIARAVAHADGNKSEAARLLGISRARLLRRLSADAEQGSAETSPEETDESGN
ncbi:MAG: helix-turn-helix domain-containing protein [Pirellulaceae bacterium]